MFWGTGIQVLGLGFRVGFHRSLMSIYFTVSALSSPGRYEEIFVTQIKAISRVLRGYFLKSA